MIGGKTSPEVLTMFESYRKLHPSRISLNRFMVFSAIGSGQGRSAKAALRQKVDKLLSGQLEKMGLARDKRDGDIYYLPRDRRMMPKNHPPVKVFYDPSLATWKPSRLREIEKAKQVHQEACWQALREEAEAERASVRNIRVKKKESIREADYQHSHPSQGERPN